MASPRTYSGKSQEQRQSARREQLIKAARKLVSTDGIAKLTVTAVCDEAGLIKRYFYENFASTELLLEAVFDQVASESAQEVFEAVVSASGDARERIRTAVDRTMDTLMADPVYRQLASEVETDVARAQVALTNKVVELSMQLASALVLDAQLDSREVHATVLFGVAGGIATINGWITGSVTLSREQVVDLVTGMFESMLTYVEDNILQAKIHLIDDPTGIERPLPR